jgi:hypothetical protein
MVPRARALPAAVSLSERMPVRTYSPSDFAVLVPLPVSRRTFQQLQPRYTGDYGVGVEDRVDERIGRERDAISDTTTTVTLRSVEVPTLVLDSEGSSDNLTGWAATVARQLPDGSHRSLPGEWHSVPDAVLAPVLLEFFREGAVTPRAAGGRRSAARRRAAQVPPSP